MSRDDPTAPQPHLTAAEVVGGLDLSERVAVVTGATGGLGVETARALASAGCSVTATGRTLAKAAAAAAAIEATGLSGPVEPARLELLEAGSVDSFVSRWLDGHDRLDYLICNAGVMAAPLSRNRRGWESQFATNHLGHFRLAAGLCAVMQRTGGARVVVLSSGAHVIAGVDFEDPNFDRRAYDPWTAYGQSKTANALFALDFDRRYRDHGVHAFAVHPGMIDTAIGRHLSADETSSVRAMATSAGIVSKSVAAGAATTVWAATCESLNGFGGAYLEDCAVARPLSEGGSVADHARSPSDAARLWDLSEALLASPVA